ncbi:hypothetical protein TK5_25520 [Sideroxyarcus sp. TK5]
MYWGDRYHYDKDGKYKGKTTFESPDTLTFVLLVIVIFSLFGLGHSLWEKSNHFAFLKAAPYKYAVLYYQVVLIFPVKLGLYFSSFAKSITPWPNLNWVISMGIFVGYAATLLWVVKKALFDGMNMQKRIVVGLGIVLGPGLVALSWLLLSSVISWLFATS